MSRLQLAADAAAGLVVLIAGAALAGWLTHAAALMAWSAHGVAMNPLTAVSFLAAALGLLMARTPAAATGPRLLVLSLGVLLIVIALLRVGGYAMGLPQGLDTWLAGARSDPSGAASRMAPNTAAGFLLAGLGLACDRRWPRVASAAALGVLLLGVTALAGHGLGGAPLQGLPGFIPMALNTAVTFVALAVGLLASRPERSPLSLLLADGPGSALARRVVPWAALAAVGAGWVLRLVLRRGWLDLGTAVALLAVALLCAVVALLLWAAGSLNRYDMERRRFFELSQDLLAVADYSGHFVELNPQWERTFGWSRADLMARPFIELVHPDDVAATLGEYARANAGGTVLRFTNRYQTRDGGYRWLEWSATTMPQLKRGFAVARDVTDLRRLERDLQERVEELREANHELEAFSYSVSHDLRAPLRHLAGFAELLTSQAAGMSDDARRWLGIIQAATRRMSALIDDLLAFSRLGRAALKAAPVDLTALIADVWDEVRPAAGSREVRWSLALLPAVTGDAALLRVAFVNLLNNALKYTATRPVAEICVEGGSDGDDVVVTVRDNGVGFDMTYAHKLFGVFQRLHSRDEFDGTGVGLATVRRIVVRHGGRVRAEAEPGVGAAFTVTLPRAAPGAAA